MAVTQPQILHVLDASSGTTVTNYGSVATNGTVAQGTVNTHWSWNPGTPFLGYWRAITGVGTANQPYIADTAIAMPNTIQSMWGAIGFQLASFDTVTNTGYLYGRNISGSQAGGLSFVVVPPTSSNNFNLQCRVMSVGGSERAFVFENLLFNTDYQAVMMVNMTTITAVTGKAVLNAGAVQNISGSANFDGSQFFGTDGGWSGRGFDFTTYRGYTGRLYYVAEGRGTLLVDQDMLDINANPAVIGGWPLASAVVPVTGVASTAQLGTAVAIGRPAPPYTLTTITG